MAEQQKSKTYRMIITFVSMVIVSIAIVSAVTIYADRGNTKIDSIVSELPADAHSANTAVNETYTDASSLATGLGLTTDSAHANGFSSTDVSNNTPQAEAAFASFADATSISGEISDSILNR